MITLLESHQAVPDEPGYARPLPALSHAAGGSMLTCIIGPEIGPPRAYLHMLAAIRPPRQGELKIIGRKISRLDSDTWSHVRRRTGYVAGETPLLSGQNGLENVMLPALYHRIASPGEVERRARELLEQLGCQADLSALPAFMSGLECVIVRLARALILDPQILYLEYPFEGLGTEARKTMGTTLAQLKRDKQLCMVAAVGNLPFVKDHADQIVFVSRKTATGYSGWQQFAETTDPEARRYLSDEGGV